jgi:cell division protein FtsQ
MRAVKKPPRRRRALPHAARGIVFWAVPLGLVALIATAAATPAGRPVWQYAANGALQLTAALGFVVTNIEVEGREATDPETIMAALDAARGTPILGVSPSQAKEKLQRLPWVRSASVERRLPHTLYIRLDERRPLALWQHGGRQELIDHDGTVIPNIELTRFPHLPIVVGEGAAPHARALLDMLRTEPRLAERVGAAIWVGGRRWNLRIDHTIDVYLPEEDAAEAWAHLAELERTDGLLQRDVQVVDMRLPDRLVIRANAAPPREIAPKKPRGAGKAT